MVFRRQVLLTTWLLPPWAPHPDDVERGGGHAEVDDGVLEEAAHVEVELVVVPGPPHHGCGDPWKKRSSAGFSDILEKAATLYYLTALPDQQRRAYLHTTLVLENFQAE